MEGMRHMSSTVCLGLLMRLVMWYCVGVVIGCHRALYCLRDAMAVDVSVAGSDFWNLVQPKPNPKGFDPGLDQGLRFRV